MSKWDSGDGIYCTYEIHGRSAKNNKSRIRQREKKVLIEASREAIEEITKALKELGLSADIVIRLRDISP